MSPGVSASDAGVPTVLREKERRLSRLLGDLGSVLVAYSGGADSAYLAWIATRELGRKAVCVTAESASYPQRHRQMAVDLARQFGFHHEFVATLEMERPEYLANPADRCYYCKQELFGRLTELARARGLAAVADGNNADDWGDYRPGRRAAREFGVLSPLDQVDLTKDDIRQLSRDAGLPSWDEPASACLSSRIPYDSPVTDAKLRMIEQAESVLFRLGFRSCRVRHHDQIARIEVAQDDIARVVSPEVRAVVASELKAIGFRYVSLDLEGYRTGSLNEGIRLRRA